MPTTRGTARRAGARAQGADIPPVDPNQMTVFGDGGDNVVRGEVLVVLAPDAAAGIATSVPTGPSRGLFEGISTTFGLDALDRTMRDMGVRSITRLHAPGPPRPFGGVLLADPDELASTYRVRFDPATPVDQAVQRLVAAGEVVTAEPIAGARPTRSRTIPTSRSNGASRRSTPLTPGIGRPATHRSSSGSSIPASISTTPSSNR